jgi:hypothetical protein
MNMRSRSVGLVVVVGVVAAILTGCAKSEVVPSTGPHSPTTPDKVTIYQKPPKLKYEKLGTVEATRSEGAKWDEHGDASKGFDALKAKAAAMGANGLLLEAPKGTYDIWVTAGYNGTFHQVPVRNKSGEPTAIAEAIYVHPKE